MQFVDAPEYNPTGTYGGGMMDLGVSDDGLGPPNLTLAGVLLLAGGLVWYTHSSLAPIDLIKVTLPNALTVFVLYITAKAFLLLGGSWLATKGVNIPGLAAILAL